MSETTDTATATTTARASKKAPRKGATRARPNQAAVMRARLSALEADYFALVDGIRQAQQSGERNAMTLDDLEEVLDAQVNVIGESLGQAARWLDWGRHAFTSTLGTTGTLNTAQQQVQHLAQPTAEQLRAWVATAVAPRVRATHQTKKHRQVRWCRRWWLHWEAEERLTALYLVYHELSASGDPGWRSVYLRDHLDHHLVELTHPLGPLHACSPGEHHDAEPLGQLDDTAGESR